MTYKKLQELEDYLEERYFIWEFHSYDRGRE
jgi:hypothetical protein